MEGIIPELIIMMTLNNLLLCFSIFSCKIRSMNLVTPEIRSSSNGSWMWSLFSLILWMDGKNSFYRPLIHKAFWSNSSFSISLPFSVFLFFLLSPAKVGSTWGNFFQTGQYHFAPNILVSTRRCMIKLSHWWPKIIRSKQTSAWTRILSWDLLVKWPGPGNLSDSVFSSVKWEW